MRFCAKLKLRLAARLGFLFSSVQTPHIFRSMLRLHRNPRSPRLFMVFWPAWRATTYLVRLQACAETK
jgi:hypothetical protein